MIPTLFSGGVKGFTQCSRFEADRLSSEAGAAFAAYHSDVIFQIHYFIEDRLEVAQYDRLMRTWMPMVREWGHDLFSQLTLIHADLG
jgi:hypothetical protein